MGRRHRQRERLSNPDRRAREQLAAPTTDYRDAEGNVLTLRGSLSPKARREYDATMRSGLQREDAAQRALELLFERLARSWTIADLEITKQRELLGRYRLASAAEREFVRNALREHAEQNFPELEVP